MTSSNFENSYLLNAIHKLAQKIKDLDLVENFEEAHTEIKAMVSDMPIALQSKLSDAIYELSLPDDFEWHDLEQSGAKETWINAETQGVLLLLAGYDGVELNFDMSLWEKVEDMGESGFRNHIIKLFTVSDGTRYYLIEARYTETTEIPVFALLETEKEKNEIQNIDVKWAQYYMGGSFDEELGFVTGGASLLPSDFKEITAEQFTAMKDLQRLKVYQGDVPHDASVVEEYLDDIA